MSNGAGCFSEFSHDHYPSKLRTSSINRSAHPSIPKLFQALLAKEGIQVNFQTQRQFLKATESYLNAFDQFRCHAVHYGRRCWRFRCCLCNHRLQANTGYITKILFFVLKNIIAQSVHNYLELRFFDFGNQQTQARKNLINNNTRVLHQKKKTINKQLYHFTANPCTSPLLSSNSCTMEVQIFFSESPPSSLKVSLGSSFAKSERAMKRKSLSLFPIWK